MTKKINPFSVIAAIAVFALGLRLVTLSVFPPALSVAESAEPGQKFDAVDKPAAPAKEEERTASSATEEKTAAPKTEAAAPPPPAEESFSASEIQVLQSLSKRREELEKREQALIRREALLKAAEGEVDRKVEELNKIRGEISALLDTQQKEQDARIASLVKIYEGMKPSDAARIFNTLDMNVVIAVIGKMSERKSAPVLAAMEADKARAVTLRLSEQHKLPELPAASAGPKPAAPN